MKRPSAPAAAKQRARWRRAAAWTTVAVLLTVGGAVGLVVNTRTGTGTDGAATREETALDFIEEQLRAQGTPGAAFAVLRDGKVVASETLGEGVTTSSRFLIGSLSKPFTAVALMQLVEHGKVDLDAPVTDYIPWFATADDDAVITVRHLLNQTSGLPTWAGQVDLDKPQTTLEQRVRAVSEVQPVHQPGEVHEYCNKNFATLGLIVERVSGMPYADYLQRHVLNPLGMDHTFTDLDRARDTGMVEGSSVWFGAHVPTTLPSFPGALSDGYVVSTVDDLARFAQAQVPGNNSGRKVVSEESLDMMRAAPPGVAPDEFYDAKYGLGWRVATVNGQPVTFHEGELPSYRADFGVLPEQGSGLVILTAHNTMLADLGSAYRGGIAILAGGPTPPVDRGFFTAYLANTALGAIVVAALLCSGVALVRRVRGMRAEVLERGRTRAVAIPVLGRLLLAGALYVVVFYGLGQAMGQPGFMRLSMAYGWVPDLTTVVLAVVGYHAAAAVVLLVAGLTSCVPAASRSSSRLAGRGFRV
jgi:CubicO group peptidase (beta-lactamase class C family)